MAPKRKRAVATGLQSVRKSRRVAEGRPKADGERAAGVAPDDTSRKNDKKTKRGRPSQKKSRQELAPEPDEKPPKTAKERLVEE